MAINNILPLNLLKSSHFLFQIMRLPKVISDIGTRLEETPAKDPTTGEPTPLKNFDLPNIDIATFTKNISLLCDSIEFPGQTLTATDYRIPGTKQIKVPYMRDYSEITATFYYPESVPLYDFFNGWIDRASPRNTKNEFFDNIIGDARIIQFLLGGESADATDFDGHVPYMFVNIKGLYPLSMVNLPGNWSDDGFHKISVTFFFEEIDTKILGRQDDKIAIDRAQLERDMEELDEFFKKLDEVDARRAAEKRQSTRRKKFNFF